MNYHQNGNFHKNVTENTKYYVFNRRTFVNLLGIGAGCGVEMCQILIISLSEPKSSGESLWVHF